MLRWLHISNMVLITDARIPFEPGFNILTGETGAGKTALTQALSLLLGHKADPKIIRSGCDRALVEAAFDIASLPQVQDFLVHHEIPFSPDEDLIIRRDIASQGKSRSSIGGFQISSLLLQELSGYLIEMASQNATATLRDPDEQLKMVDLFGGHGPLVEEFGSIYRHLLKLQQQRQELAEREAMASERRELYRHQYEEISSLQLAPDEEESLFTEFRTLSDQKKEGESVAEIQTRLASLPSFKPLLSALSRLSPSPRLEEVATLIENAGNQLSEASFLIESLLADISFDEERLEQIDERLGLINKLKKKYGDLEVKKEELRSKLDQFETIESDKETLEKEIATLSETLASISLKLTDARVKSAQEMAAALTEILQGLNLPSARLLIEIGKNPRTLRGDNSARFLLAANPGEPAASLKDRVSGGELARVFFALKVIFADRENLPILIFDEVDANIGGQTATEIGKRLKDLGRHRQVIAITHFPQVAVEADHHLSVEKREEEGRTFTLVKKLSESDRPKELLRMLGGFQVETIVN